MNRVLLHLSGCRCHAARQYVEAAEVVADCITETVGDGVLEFWIPSAGAFLEGERITFYIRGGDYELDALDSASEEVAEVLASMSRRLAVAAAALQEAGR